MDRSEATMLEPIDPTPDTLRRRRVLYAVVTTAVVSLLCAAILDGLDVVDTFGVDVRTETAVAADGRTLLVDHAAVTRPALASPLRIEVDGLTDGEVVRIGIERAYLSIWDHNAVFPAPERESSAEPWIVWEYEATGPRLVIEIDGRLEPAVQSSRTGHVALLDDTNHPLAEVALRTRVLP